MENNQDNVYQDNPELYYKKIKSVPVPEKNIGIDINGSFYDNIIGAGENSTLDISKIQSFTQMSQNREQMMQLIDTMCEDPTIASALEIYAEDATECNDKGKIVWCESADPVVAEYVNFLLDTMNVDKNIYRWVYSLCKYGDVYLRLYRNSEYGDDLFNSNDEQDEHVDLSKNKRNKLNEAVYVTAFKDNDNYSHYIEMHPNPAEMFELTRFGKSYAFVKADVLTSNKIDNFNNSYYRYQFKKDDVFIYDATTYVHACLEDNISRAAEEIEIFKTQADYDNNKNSLRYSVRRGQSIFHNIFKIWREMTLLENSMLLNRLTKSSITRIIGVEVGDMAKESIGPHLMKIKSLIEQKTAFDARTSMEEYTNPGPVENNVYVPTRHGIGSLSSQQIGGDVNVTGLDDVDFFKNKLYSALRIPKQYLGDTNDAGGFDGGTSLALISARYAKAIKRIQTTMRQALTDAVNLMLIDKNLTSYINKFEIKMQTPTTQEEKDRQDTAGNKINMISDIMNLLDGANINNQSIKLQILKTMLSNVITDSQVLSLIQDQIDEFDDSMDNMPQDNEIDQQDNDNISRKSRDININTYIKNPDNLTLDNVEKMDDSETQQYTNSDETILPLPSELGIGDLSDMNSSEEIG